MTNRRGSLAATVERGLLAQMLDGSFVDGQRLPSEVELSLSFSVSRSVVREALKRLQTAGLVRTIHGSGGGSFFQRPDLSAITEQLYFVLQLNGVTTENLMEARLLLAPPMAALAAARGTPDDIRQLDDIWNAHESQSGPRFPGQMIEEFHLKLAAMTHNPALEAAARPLIQLVRAAFEPAAELMALDGEPSIMALQWSVLEAVKSRNTELAEQRMRDLMETAYMRLHSRVDDFTKPIPKSL